MECAESCSLATSLSWLTRYLPVSVAFDAFELLLVLPSASFSAYPPPTYAMLGGAASVRVASYSSLMHPAIGRPGSMKSVPRCCLCFGMNGAASISNPVIRENLTEGSSRLQVMSSMAKS